jgi:hypothetical protein
MKALANKCIENWFPGILPNILQMLAKVVVVWYGPF